MYTLSHSPSYPHSSLADIQAVPPPSGPRTHDHYWACLTDTCSFWCYDATKRFKHDNKPNHDVVRIEIPSEGASPYRTVRPGIEEARAQVNGATHATFDNVLRTLLMELNLI